MKKNICLKKFINLFLMLSCVFTVTSCASQGVTSFEKENQIEAEYQSQTENTEKEDNNYSMEVDITMEGGSGKAYIKSPVKIDVNNGNMTACFVWNSKNYDYMIVEDVKYENENTDGESTFNIPIKNLDEPLTVIGNTVAMSKPHEIEYVIYWNSKEEEKHSSDEQKNAIITDSEKISVIGGITLSEEIEFKYAKCLSIKKYGDYKLISIENSGNYLVVPQGMEAPNDIPASVTILKQPLDKTYLVSSSVMDFVNKLGSLNMIRLSGTRAEDWSIEEAVSAMKQGKILYAGKYRAPDYELILSEGCNLAIENTMIYHEPDVKEKLEELGIPVMVETSSYEKHPLGRLEWIKLYGVLFDKEEEAVKYFDGQLDMIEDVIEKDDTSVTVAFFHVTANGMINVRKSDDYISKMIDLAGGEYVIKSDNEDEDNASSTMNMQMEDFYAAAKDADIIIYNSTIAGEISSIDELIEKNALFADFKAVKDKKVFCTSKDFFQQTTSMAEFISDLNSIFTGEDRDCVYIIGLE